MGLEEYLLLTCGGEFLSVRGFRGGGLCSVVWAGFVLDALDTECVL